MVQLDRRHPVVKPCVRLSDWRTDEGVAVDLPRHCLHRRNTGVFQLVAVIEPPLDEEIGLRPELERHGRLKGPSVATHYIDPADVPLVLAREPRRYSGVERDIDVAVRIKCSEVAAAQTDVATQRWPRVH